MGLEYWLFIHQLTPIALFFFGNEPVNLISPPGTPIGMIRILEYNHLKDFITDVAKKSMELGKKGNAKYIFIPKIPIEQNKIISALKKQGF